MKDKKQPQIKVPKDVELTSLMASFVISEKEIGDEVGITEFAKSLQLSNKSHPHVHTVEKQLRKWKIIQELVPPLKYIEDKKTGRISKVRVLDPPDSSFKKEIRSLVMNLQNQIDNGLKNLENKINSIKLEKK